ncbi:MAG: hypothetical protein H6679_02965 [Epsilonproteobacteria bacterium]|nr:hypothetical protein [Campylobacterota bacterium]
MTSAVFKQQRFFLVILFLMSFALRAVVFHCYLAHDNNYWQVDSRTYDRIAQSIAQGKGYAEADGTPHFYRVPVYPAFLALWYKIFGHDHIKALWPQVLLASFIPLLIFTLSLILFSKQLLLAQCVGVFAALHIGLVLYAGFMMTETLFILLLLLFLIFFCSSFKLFFCKYENGHPPELPNENAGVEYVPRYAPPNELASQYYTVYKHTRLSQEQRLQYIEGDPIARRLFMSGFFLGLASLVRPVGHYMLLLALLLLFASNDELRHRIGNIIIVCSAWLIPAGFWLVRNYLLAGAFFFHTLPGGHFLYLSGARVAMHVHNCSYQQAREVVRLEVNQMIERYENEINRSLNEIERCYVHEQLAKKYFKAKPLYTLKYWLTDMLRACGSLYSAELLYLDSGRAEVDYFAKDRSYWSMFSRYLFPQTSTPWLKVIVFGEIISFFLILLGYLLGAITMIIHLLKKRFTFDFFQDFDSWIKACSFIALFIVISLAGGYARMRLPAEPLIIILSFWSWGSLVYVKFAGEK